MKINRVVLDTNCLIAILSRKGNVANAQYIVSEDSHFKHLKNIPFPTVNVIRLVEFMNLLM